MLWENDNNKYSPDEGDGSIAHSVALQGQAMGGGERATGLLPKL